MRSTALKICAQKEKVAPLKILRNEGEKEKQLQGSEGSGHESNRHPRVGSPKF